MAEDQGKSERTNDEGNGERELRPFWSGTLSFGLVSVPVDLYPGQRRRRLSLRMLDAEGTPLVRRYFCPKEDRELSSEEIVRAYERGVDELVVVSDEELDALAPEKSRDIDLRVFVPREQIPPLYLDRPYFLTPGGDSTKPYRLLAETMERTDRAGIATFVLRGKEYLVVIFSEGGVLRAQTLRFAEEVRTPEDIGLPEPQRPDSARVRRMKKAIRALARTKVDPDELVDVDTRRLREAVASAEEKVVQASEEAPDAEREWAEVVDLMEVLKRKLRGEDGRARVVASEARRSASSLEDQSREELYARAREFDIAGRSKMSKRELIKALRAHG